MNQNSSAVLHKTAPLVSPRELAVEFPPDTLSYSTIVKNRDAVRKILRGEDNRLIVIAGPCSIHDTVSALEYSDHLNNLRLLYEDKLLIIMRVYLEKPRTSTGWKGLINDPYMDGSCSIEEGLRIARKLLLSITSKGLAAGMELLNPLVSHYISDLASWVSVGARTSESQVHREMASSLSMPVGFKNPTNGNIESSVNSILSATEPHSFLSIDRNGQACVARTEGNSDCHLVLRGSIHGPNYELEHIEAAESYLMKKGITSRIIIDCSHNNSDKNASNQIDVCKKVVSIRKKTDIIAGIMLESNINHGQQEIPADLSKLKYGISVTDECLGWNKTEQLLREIYNSVSPVSKSKK
jgi:3-deoxy-7-phosphoheptulonate synthase